MSNAAPEKTDATVGTRRSVGIAGVTFAVLFLVGFFVGGQTPEYDAPDQEWMTSVEDGTMWVVSAVIMTLAGLSLLVFANGLANLLRNGGVHTHSPSVVAAAGTLSAAFIILAILIASSISAALIFNSTFPTPSADIIRVLDQLAISVLLIGACWPFALMIAAAARAGAGVLPRWLIVSSYVAAVVLLFSPMFLPLVLVPLWALAVGVSLLRSRG